jgi:hypothetical protein
MLLLCTPARREDQQGDFPNGLPTPSAVIDAQLIYDPRDVGQTQGDKSTYVFSDNPILCLLAYLTDANGGMGLDYARFIEPTIDFWKAAADECDGLVDTSGMHATLLDAAAVGDNKIFLADTTGLSVGMTVQLPTENVDVSGFGLAGEVDITGTLANAHAAGELAYWPGFGQTVLYRCASDLRPRHPARRRHQVDPGHLRRLARAARRRRLGVRTNTVYDAGFTLSGPPYRRLPVAALPARRAGHQPVRGQLHRPRQRLQQGRGRLRRGR